MREVEQWNRESSEGEQAERSRTIKRHLKTPMSESEAIRKSIAELERQGVYSFGKDSPLRSRHPDSFTSAEVAGFDDKVLEDYSVAKRIIESARILLNLTRDVT